MYRQSDKVTLIDIHRNVDTHGMGKVVGVGSSAHRKVTAKRPAARRSSGWFVGVDISDTSRVCGRNTDAAG